MIPHTQYLVIALPSAFQLKNPTYYDIVSPPVPAFCLFTT
jgi:hypothetical protein